MVECCKKCLRSVQLDNINHCFPFIFFLFISRERTRNFASNVLGLTREKCMDVEKNGGEKIFFSCRVSRQEDHSGALTGCVLRPEKIIT